MANISVTYTFSNSTTADATQVNQNFTDIINGTSDGTKDFSISALTVGGNATFNGNVTLGNASSDDLTLTASLASTINIKTTNTYDIGSSTKGLRYIYIGDTADSNTFRIGGQAASGDITLDLPLTSGTLGVEINDLSAVTAIDMASDYVKIYDATTSDERKILVDNLLGGVRPSFYASRSSSQTIASSTATKVQYNSEGFDTNSNYDNATNYRFTPTVAGKYLIIASAWFGSTVDTATAVTYIYKNGFELAKSIGQASTTKEIGAIVVAVVDLNGSTDYVEGYAFQDTGSDKSLTANGAANFFMGMRIA